MSKAERDRLNKFGQYKPLLEDGWFGVGLAVAGLASLALLLWSVW